MMTAADIAARLELDRYRHSWRGTCPACDYSRAFALSAKKGRTLFYCANGCTQETLAETLASVAGAGWQAPAAPARNQTDAARREQSTADALKIWAGSTTALGTVADTYLTDRALPGLAALPALRFRGDCHHPDIRGRFRALVALVVDVTGKPVAVHRTYLDAGGHKAAIEPNKASKGPVWGGAIRLDAEAPEIVIGEGIESSASAGRLLNLPAWAALSAGNLAKGMILPPTVRAVVIAADADSAGRKAADTAADRWRSEGRAVRIALPNADGQDFNDILRAQGAVTDAT
jgi:putative DNA primase/helicase